jgi:broad specificity phosphatase PhoE
MYGLSRLVLVRHGETVGNSSTRFHGRGDVELCAAGREQARDTRAAIPGEGFELVVASPLRRAWQMACLVAPGHRVRLEADFREIDFGRWEGLTKAEIAACDPIFYEDWQARAPGFEFPEGERRADFQARVLRGLETLRASGASSAIVVAHKGVIRTLVQAVCGVELAPELPALGGVVQVMCRSDGQWHVGRRSSDPRD